MESKKQLLKVIRGAKCVGDGDILLLLLLSYESCFLSFYCKVFTLRKYMVNEMQQYGYSNVLIIGMGKMNRSVLV